MTLPFAQRHAITDICLLVEDAGRSIEFYVNRLGFALRRRAEGFADFTGAGLTLAVWERAHIAAATGLADVPAPRRAHKAAVAIELASPAEIDAAHAELSAAGVSFVRPPADYPWNARCCYFLDPDDTVWELYAWLAGGPVGDVGGAR